MASRMLLRGVALFEVLAQVDESLSQRLLDMAEACGLVAPEVERAPFGLTVRKGAVLSEILPLGSDRSFSNAEVACMLLRNSAALFRGAAGADGADEVRPELLEAGFMFDWAADELDQAPGGHTGPELEALKPYLVAVRGGGDVTPPDEKTTRQLLASPRFAELIRTVFEIAYGRDFSTLDEQIQLAWAGRVASVWLRLEGQAAEPLTEDQRAAVAYAVQHPRAAWCMPPIVTGDWTDASPADAAVLLTMISEVARVGQAGAPLAVACYCDRVRTRPLACHGGVLLVEAQGYAAGGQPGVIQALVHPERIFLCDGLSDGLHHFNDRFGARLDTAEARRDYFMLFVNWVRTLHGSRFQPLATPDALAGRLVGETVLPDAPPIRESGPDETGAWRMDTRLCFEDGVWDAVFILTPQGLVTMVEETEVAVGLPVTREVQDGWLVRLDGAWTMKDEA